MNAQKGAYREYVLKTPADNIVGTEGPECLSFRGIPYAHAGRFRYAVPAELVPGETVTAVENGPACPQLRTWHPHLDNPHRLFYHKEFREGIDFVYDEDCLRLNIFTPKRADRCPVMVFYHGGGFDSGANSEGAFDGAALAAKGIITVFAQYRVGVLGYLTHEEIQAEYGRDGNFGLDDQVQALQWVRRYIGLFGGDPDNITLAGQSAGAISVQYLCLDRHLEGTFRRALMMSGGGLFLKFALPRRAEATRPYFQELAKEAGCRTLAELRTVDVKTLIDAADRLKASRKDTIYNVMPVVDGYRIEKPVGELIAQPHIRSYMIGYTNTDMYAPVMAFIGNRFGKKNGAYLYYFDIDAPGDGNGAFHSCDLRYIFGTLAESWRPYGEHDRKASQELVSYTANFVRNGDPNGEGLPAWKQASSIGPAAVLRIGEQKTAMGHVHYLPLLKNMLTKGDPKA